MSILETNPFDTVTIISKRILINYQEKQKEIIEIEEKFKVFRFFKFDIFKILLDRNETSHFESVTKMDSFAA